MIDSALNIFAQTMTRLMNNKAVYRTAPATPGLLNIYLTFDKFINLNMQMSQASSASNVAPQTCKLIFPRAK